MVDKDAAYRSKLFIDAEQKGESVKNLLDSLRELYDPEHIIRYPGIKYNAYINPNKKKNKKDDYDKINDFCYVKFIPKGSDNKSLFITLAFQSKENAKLFLEDFSISPQMISTASYIDKTKQYYITLKSNIEFGKEEYKSDIIDKILCNSIKRYGVIKLLDYAVIPSDFNDRHLNPNNLEPTTNLKNVVIFAQENFTNTDINYQNFITKLQHFSDFGIIKIENIKSLIEDIPEKYENLVNTLLRTSHENPITFYRYNNKYRSQYTIITWNRFYNKILKFLFAQYAKNSGLDQPTAQLTLEDVYTLMYIFEYKDGLNPVKIQKILVEKILQLNFITSWDEEKETFIFRNIDKMNESSPVEYTISKSLQNW